MTEKTQSILAEFARRVRHALGDRVRRIVLFGSHARGDARDYSDYDVLVVVDRRTPELHSAILDIECELEEESGAFISCFLRSESVYEANRRLGMPLYANVEAEGIAF